MKRRRKIVPETSRPFCEGPEVRKREPGKERVLVVAVLKQSLL